MRKLLLLIYILPTQFFSQESPIEEYLTKVEHLDHKGCVKSIFVEDAKFDKNEEKIDYLSKTYKVIYDNRGRIRKQLIYWKDLQNPFKITTYDTLNRVSKVEINRDDGNGEILIPYFRDDLKDPDSIKTFSLEMKERRKYINYFKNGLVIRRDLFENDTLRYYTLFEYDSNNHLSKELNINTKDGFGVINKLGNSTTKYLNKNDSTLYNYREVGDTIIIDRERHKGLVVTEKSYENDDVIINIEKQTSTARGFTFQTRTNFKWKDSTKIEYKYYKDKDDLKSYTNTYIYEDKIISEWMNYIGQPEQQDVTDIKTTFDNKGNWISKTFIRNNVVVEEIRRTIDYCEKLH
ncbi:hypothetical protein [Salegentibacter mishustinae]|uniref:hypothetical protein n=1 Tax=Salegentibacter mishustinae TaxID=270918 RepID=UPI00249211EC|nr:hypothetical protein [Salegentibacter mishustinae]